MRRRRRDPGPSPIDLQTQEREEFLSWCASHGVRYERRMFSDPPGVQFRAHVTIDGERIHTAWCNTVGGGAVFPGVDQALQSVRVIEAQIFDMEKQQRYLDAIRGIAEGSRVAPR